MHNQEIDPIEGLQAYQNKWLYRLTEAQLADAFFFQPPNAKTIDRVFLCKLDAWKFAELINPTQPGVPTPNQIRLLLAADPDYVAGSIAPSPPFAFIIQSYFASSNAEVPPYEINANAPQSYLLPSETMIFDKSIAPPTAEAMMEDWAALPFSEVEENIVVPGEGRVKAYIFSNADVQSIQNLATPTDDLYVFFGINTVLLGSDDPYGFRPILKVGDPLVKQTGYFEFSTPCPPACGELIIGAPN